jgi:hypothetical protein
MAENLRVKAAHEPGAEGAEEARPVADAIDSWWFVHDTRLPPMEAV